MSYINGIVLRSKLNELGSKILDRDFIQNNNETKQDWLKRINEGKKNLDKAVGSQFIGELKNQLKIIHSNRIILNDIKYGNILIEEKTNNPYLIDFDFARHYPKINQKLFDSLARRDLKQFNLLFN